MVGFSAQAFFLLLPNELQKQGTPGWMAITRELTVVCPILVFVFLQVSHCEITRRHWTALVIGSLIPRNLLARVHEYVWKGTPANPKTGMLTVGTLATALLFAWRYVLLRRERKTRP